MELMKETTFNPGEWCRFPNSEIPAMLDLLRENGYPVYRTHNRANSDLIGPDENAIGMNIITGKFNHLNCDNPNSFMTELTRSEFLYKATLGNIKPEVEFDPSRPFEVGNVSDEWYQHYSDWHYVGVGDNDNHVIQQKGTHKFLVFGKIRNIIDVTITAPMLEVGECMEVTDIGPYENFVLMRMDNENFCCLDTGQKVDWNYKGKGRRVKVKITTEEI